MNRTTLVLDAMGVMYLAADDVAELLIPFVQDHGGISDRDQISRNYILASVGKIDVDTFWKNVGLSADLEDRYLESHELTPGLVEFLTHLPSSITSVWCLSNDVSRWSSKLRTLHQLEELFDGFVISEDAQSRKPDQEIYETLLAATGEPPESHLFVDDRLKNLDAAASLGFRTAHFSRRPDSNPSQAEADICFRAADFSDLRDYLLR